MKKKLSLLGALLPMILLMAALLPPAAGAATTNIAQVPLLNINGTGTVKPNLMLLFDNSGSMDQDYTPDYVNDNLCRTGAALVNGVTACTVGYPPFMSPDFNKQYYNPAILYSAPIDTTSTSLVPTYKISMTAANTATWTSVTGDGFNAHKNDMFGNTITSGSNLVTGFPDLKWCNASNTSSCGTNSATYTYPDATFTRATAITGNPYYYTIGVGEYCTDNTMTTCISTSVGAPAPNGYPVPVKVRWCTTTALTVCQGKRVGAYIYPRYSTPTGAAASYGTIAINASASTSSLTITGVTIPDPTTARTITNGTITASTGTDTALKQQTVASALAASIIAKTGLTNQYWACVSAPLAQSTVAPCSSYGITLGGNNIVAVIPVTCSGSKSAANCTVLTDSSRSGWGITVTAPSVNTTALPPAVPSTALLNITGTTGTGSTAPTLASISYNGTTLASNIALGTNKSAAAVASTIVNAIGTAGTVKAYVGGNAVTATCAAKSTSSVCLVDSAATANGRTITTGTLTNASQLVLTKVSGAGYTVATDAIPTVTTALAAGATPPSTFVRTDIVSTRNAYPKSTNRTDCVTTAGTCTYAEEMTNFANWYAYYKTRLQMMKSSIGVAFSPLTGSYRVGYVRLSVAGVYGTIDIKPIDFTGTARTAWYTTLYNTVTSGSTPTRPAMDAVGRMFANQSPYAYASGSEVVQFPCQQNFMILTTDGYWNGGSASNVVNNDNIANSSRFCTLAGGCVDTRAQSQPSISDVSLYWYNGGSNTGTVSLRPVLEPNMNVPGQVGAAAGENTHLHMTTFTLGLGVDGIMNYEQNYDTAPVVGGDFYNLISGTPAGCSWNAGGAYVWPDPDVTNTASTVQERVDDLWHAAINGHGKYFSASDPTQVVAGLSAAITKLQQTTGAAAAAATSTPNISQEDNDIFSDTFTTVVWYGELSDKKIDPVSGIVGTTPVWTSSQKLAPMVAASTDARNIMMLDTSVNPPAMKNFKFAAANGGNGMTATEQGWFSNKCNLLAQCASLSTTDQAIVNTGGNMVNWLRGQQLYADGSHFRAYGLTPAVNGTPGVVAVLGDIVSSQPAYLRDPRKSYTTTGYAAYKTAQAARSPVVFTAANDGMLHAFNATGDATGGNELWAYVPRITMKKLYLQSSTTYATNHQFTTDGSPVLGDVQIGGVWKTVLVAGLNAGGRGYYALDVTDPANPKPLWEMCADSTVCSVNDPDIGLTFGNPEFGMWNNQWVVYLTSGYNNVPSTDGVATGSGQGILYVVDVATGTVLKKLSTGSGNTTTPSGLAKITAISLNPQTDPVTTYIYGGDNQGQMWRFDMTTANPSVLLMGSAVNGTGTVEPITTRPDVTTCVVSPKAADGTALATFLQKVVVFGTGRLLDVPDVTDTTVQSLYGLSDTGASIASIHGGTAVHQTLSLVGTGTGTTNTNTYTVSNNPVDLSKNSGWYVDWSLNAGERMNLDPKIVSGGTNVVTNIPSSTSTCSVGGTSNVYQFDACSGSFVKSSTTITDTNNNTYNIVGQTLSNTSATVGFIIVSLPDGETKLIATEADGSTQTLSVTSPNDVAAHKVGWRRVNTN